MRVRRRSRGKQNDGKAERHRDQDRFRPAVTVRSLLGERWRDRLDGRCSTSLEPATGVIASDRSIAKAVLYSDM